MLVLGKDGVLRKADEINYTVRQVANELKRPVKFLYRLRAEGKLKTWNLGRNVKIFADEIERLKKERKVLETWLTSAQAGRTLGISPRTMRRACERLFRRRVPGIERIGGRWRVDPQRLESIKKEF